jgi:serine/threonine protein kinase
MDSQCASETECTHNGVRRVYHARHTLTAEEVALKVLNISQLVYENVLHKLEREIRCMEAISHPNVLQLKTFSMEEVFDGERVAVLALELASRGELFDFMVRATCACIQGCPA